MENIVHLILGIILSAYFLYIKIILEKYDGSSGIDALDIPWICLIIMEVYVSLFQQGWMKYICLIYFLFFFLEIIYYYIIWKNYRLMKKKIRSNERKDYLVLGARLNGNKLSESLIERLNILIEIFDDEEEKIIVSGKYGRFSNSNICESEVMADYLRGIINQNNIITENESISTYENLLYSKKYIKNQVVIITNDYQVLRVRLLCKRLNYSNYIIYTASTPFLLSLYFSLKEIIGCLLCIFNIY